MIELTNLKTDMLARKATVPLRETSDGEEKALWSQRDGSLVVGGQFQALANEGKVWIANHGVAATAVTAAGAYNADTGDISIDVPAGITMIPLGIQITIAALTDNQDIVIHALASRTLCAITAAQFTPVTPINCRLDLDGTSNCTVYGSANADQGTDPNTVGACFEFWRRRWELGAAPDEGDSEEGHLLTVEWSVQEYGAAPVLVGPASLTIYITKGTAATFYSSVTWVELNSNTIV